MSYVSVATEDPETALTDFALSFQSSRPSKELSGLCSVKSEMPHPSRKWKVFPGRNKFCCDGRLMTSKQSGIFYFTCALIIITTGLFLGFDCRFLSPNLTPAIPVITVIMFVFVMSTLLRTAFSDPGIIPRATPQEAEETEKRIDTPGPSGNLQLPPRMKEVEVHGVKIKLKYCFTCKIFRPPRSSHCGVCDNCVERFDHHCPWVGNCIGKRNYRYFYMFLISLSLYCVFILSLSITTLVLMSMNEDFISAIKESPASLVEAIIAFLSVWSVFGLAGFHTYLSCCNITTNEDIKGSNFKNTNSTSLYSHDSLCANYIEVICGPLTPSLIDRRGILIASEDNQFLPSSLYSQHPQVTDDDATNTQDELLNTTNNTSTDGKVTLTQSLSNPI